MRWWVVLLVGVALAGSVSAQVRIQGDVTVRPAPEDAPASERLAYAERLYQADRLREARRIADELAKGHGPEAAEALFLLGRMQYSEGSTGFALSKFRNLLLRFPNAAPVSDGRLVDRLEQATVWLLEDYEWRLARGYLALLEDLDPAVVGRLARGLEAQLDRELGAFHARVQGRSQDLREPLEQWMERRRAERCSYHWHCRAENSGCESELRDRMRSGEPERRDRHRSEWFKELDTWYQSQRAAFAAELYQEVGDFPMLTRLLSQERVLAQVGPRERPRVSAPFSYWMKRTEYTRNDNQWRWSGTPYLGARFCHVARDPQVEELFSAFAPLRVGTIDRRELLEILGQELRPAPAETDRRPRL